MKIKMRYFGFIFSISIMFLSIVYVSAQQTHKKKYQIYIKYNDGHVLKGRFITAKDSSIILLKRDTFNVFVQEIKFIKIKKRYNHYILSGFIISTAAIIAGSIGYNNYVKADYIDFGPGAAAIYGGLFGVLIGAPVVGIIILIKELSKKTYYLNGSLLTYNFIKPSLNKLNSNQLKP